MNRALAILWALVMGFVGYHIGYSRGATVVGNRFMYEVIPFMSNTPQFTERSLTIPRSSWPCSVALRGRNTDSIGFIRDGGSVAFDSKDDMPDSVVVVYRNPVKR